MKRLAMSLAFLLQVYQIAASLIGKLSIKPLDQKGKENEEISTARIDLATR
jgi:hypothetical protein